MHQEQGQPGSLDCIGFRIATRRSIGAEPDLVFPEYLINDVPLVERLGAPPRSAGGRGTTLDMVPSLIWKDGDEAIDRLLLEAPPDLPSGRRSILVCPICGDPGCGVVSAVIERIGDTIVWTNFGIEDNLDSDDEAGAIDLQGFARVGPFSFEFTQYAEVLQQMRRVAAGTDA